MSEMPSSSRASNKLSPQRRLHTSPSMNKLTELNTLHVRQKITAFTRNKYVVCSPTGEVLFYANESAGLLVIFKGKERAFYIDIFDVHNRQVTGLRRPHTFGPTKMDVKVYGTLVSVVRVVPTLITPVMNIYDAYNQRLLRVKGPMSWQGCGNFDIFTNNKTRIGCIQKRWGGFLKEAFTEADNFVITFPRVLDVRIKAAILGTCFLIDFLYYGA